MSVTRTATTRELASFLTGLRFEALPNEAVERTKELFLDWVASALAGKNAQPVRILERFAEVCPHGRLIVKRVPLTDLLREFGRV